MSRTSRPWGPSALTVLGVVVAAGVVLLLVGWAAAIGPERAVSGGEPHWSRPGLPPPTLLNRPRSDIEFVPSEHPVITFMATWLVLAGLLLVVALISLMGVHLTRTYRRRRVLVAPPEVGFEVLDAPRELSEALGRDWDLQLALLAEGSPRNAIVAAWHRFELLAESLGHTRELWETSAEFTLRILELAEADAPAVSRLSRLYREARFSQHELGEDARAEAAAAIDAINRSLRRHTGSRR